jgi:hypothetical protein
MLCYDTAVSNSHSLHQIVLQSDRRSEAETFTSLRELRCWLVAKSRRTKSSSRSAVENKSRVAFANGAELVSFANSSH